MNKALLEDSVEALVKSAVEALVESAVEALLNYLYLYHCICVLLASVSTSVL